MPRRPNNMARRPILSAMLPMAGANSVPRCCIEAKSVSMMTLSVAVRMYQPRMSVSISCAQEVSKSAGHWKRKLRTLKGARNERREGDDTRVKMALWRSVRQ